MAGLWDGEHGAILRMSGGGCESLGQVIEFYH